jgi:hypothetical protein
MTFIFSQGCLPVCTTKKILYQPKWRLCSAVICKFCRIITQLPKIIITWLNCCLFSVCFGVWRCSYSFYYLRGSRGRDRMVVGFTATCAISAYHHLSCEFEPCSLGGVLDTMLCDKVCKWHATGRWFSPGNLVSSTKKTDRHDIAEILLKVVLDNINQTKPSIICTHVCIKEF